MECSLESAAKQLKDANNILITAHIHPDGDSLGSMLALNHYLKSIGKSVQMMLDDEVPRLYKFLPGYEYIVKPSPLMIQPDLLVVLDASDLERIGKTSEVCQAPILNIDHHISNTKFADYWFIDHKAAATGEIIFRLLEMEKVSISSQIAMCLYTAIATDCGFFRYANTSPYTLRCAAQLIESGIKPHVISEYMETKPLDSLVNMVKVLETLELHCDGKIAAITIEFSESDNSESSEGLVNYPRNIEGVEIAIMFKFSSPTTARISLRSRNVDVSKLALLFGGGGHERAAGCSITGTKSEVKQKMFKAATELLRGDIE